MQRRRRFELIYFLCVLCAFAVRYRLNHKGAEDAEMYISL